MSVLVLGDMVLDVGFNDEGNKVGNTATLFDREVNQVIVDVVRKAEGDAIAFSKTCVLKLFHCS